MAGGKCGYTMNLGTIAGLVIAAAVLIFAVVGTSTDPRLLWNAPGLSIVVGGTFAAAFISFQFHEVIRVFRVFWIALRNEKVYPRRDAEDLLRVAQAWAKGDIRAASQVMEGISNPFLRLGLELAVDNLTPLEDIVQTLRWRIEKLKNKEGAEAAILRAMAAYAPAFGMLGTLIGLIEMLRNVGGGDFAAITGSMAVALMTTLYGILLANILFKPIATKLEHRTRMRVAQMDMILASIIVMRTQRSVGVVRETLNNFTAERSDELAADSRQRDEPVHE